MKNSYVLPSLLLAVGIVIAGYLMSQTIVTGKLLDRHVTVKGLAEKEVPANLAVWPLQIAYAGNNLVALQTSLKDAGESLLLFLQDLEFSDEEISRGTTNILDAASDPYRNVNQAPVNRYTATADYTVRTTDIKKLEKALAAAPNLVSKGIIITSKNTWMPIEYFFTGLNDIKPEMIEEATKNARTVAEKFAIDSGSKVGKIKNAHQGIFSINNRDQNTPQIKEIRVVTTINYYLED